MKTQLDSPSGNRRSSLAFKFAAFTTALAFSLMTTAARADVASESSGEFRGMYKVASSSDPIFPMQARQEWFLDFGSGISSGKFSGSVAVSLRQNPNVKVRIMAWQYFPKQGSLMIGNPYSEGSRSAVAKGNWQLRPTAGGMLFERDGYRMVLHRADPRDY